MNESNNPVTTDNGDTGVGTQTKNSDMFFILKFKEHVEEYQKEAIAHFIASHFGNQIKLSKAIAV
ncbi:MAG: hypothetical protein AABY32_01940 [Nanoarchaeota archaeon]